MLKGTSETSHLIPSFYWRGHWDPERFTALPKLIQSEQNFHKQLSVSLLGIWKKILNTPLMSYGENSHLFFIAIGGVTGSISICSQLARHMLFVFVCLRTGWPGDRPCVIRRSAISWRRSYLDNRFYWQRGACYRWWWLSVGDLERQAVFCLKEWLCLAED